MIIHYMCCNLIGCGGYLIDEGNIISNHSFFDFDQHSKNTVSCEWFIESSGEDAAVLIKSDEIKYPSLEGDGRVFKVRI